MNEKAKVSRRIYDLICLLSVVQFLLFHVNKNNSTEESQEDTLLINVGSTLTFATRKEGKPQPCGDCEIICFTIVVILSLISIYCTLASPCCHSCTVKHPMFNHVLRWLKSASA